VSPDKDKDLGCEKDHRNAGEGFMAEVTKLILDEPEPKVLADEPDSPGSLGIAIS
jgi:hypothetical protein